MPSLFVLLISENQSNISDATLTHSRIRDTGIIEKIEQFDMYYLFERFEPTQILEWYDQMFHHSTSFHVIRSLTYFEDAELAEMPLVFDDKVTWESVKKRMIEVVKKNF